MSNDIVVQLFYALMKVYMWGSTLFNELLKSYVEVYPQARKAVDALGNVFNLLVNLTVFYIVLKLASKLEKFILTLLLLGWGVFGLVLLGSLNPSMAAEISKIIEKSVEIVSRALNSTSTTTTIGG
ncbi:MAG TPA: hypothetical protein EYH17_01550 [Pyrodictium sp.]|nr:hypothetical protein [Pyrodictium sp.]